MTTDKPPLEAWLSAARNSHGRLVDVVGQLTAEQIEGPSYASEWSIAQVLSHLGSGAEIFELFLGAGLDGLPVPGAEQFAPVWERWNAKAPAEQARDALLVDAQFLDKLEALDARRSGEWRLAMFGSDQELRDLVRLRLGEHALHTWDIAVIADTHATVAPDAVELLIDTLDSLVARVARPSDEPMRVRIATNSPDRRFVLRADSEGAELAPGVLETREVEATLSIDAEALVRLFYGRLDPEHTPALETDGVDVTRLRVMFPGF